MQLAFLVSTLIMGFLGSWHCGLMCGPLSCNFRKQNDFISYHLGRLISYLILGGFLFSGVHYFIDTDSRTLKLVASFIFGVLFIVFGLLQLNILKNQHLGLRYAKVQFWILKKSKTLAQKFPVVLGLLTGLFPCAWLYSFLMLSAQMPTFLQAGSVIFIFWLTSLPAFLVFTGFMKSLIQHSPVSYHKISGVILIAAGVLSVLGHWAEVFT